MSWSSSLKTSFRLGKGTDGRVPSSGAALIRSSHGFRYAAVVILCLCFSGFSAAGHAADGVHQVTPELREQAVRVLRQVLREGSVEDKVRAAELLLTLDYPEGTVEALREELREGDIEVATRLEIWQVLANLFLPDGQTNPWVDKIRGVLFDEDSSTADRVQAAKALGELGYQLEEDDRVEVWARLAHVARSAAERDEWVERVSHVSVNPDADDAVRERAREALNSLETSGAGEGFSPGGSKDSAESGDSVNGGRLAANLHWLRFLSGAEGAERDLAALLLSDAPEVRADAAFALGRISVISEEVQQRLVESAKAEPTDSAGWPRLAGAAAVHSEDETRQRLKVELLEYVRARSGKRRYQACLELARITHEDDLPELIALMDDETAAVRAAAAYAILRTGRRVSRGMSWLDWSVIILYAAAMLLTGWYYSRRTKTTEDYLLGGRTMKPLSLGLSLFATLLSAITYLAMPGEIIKNGPVFVLGKISAYPFVALIVGWFLIPVIMRLKITSAYEMLETRLGLGARMLGSVFFLSLRLMWMSLVIFATSDKVLVPVLGLSGYWWATPVLCAVLGLVTVAYTSMGGLRAVVFTDVVQTFILFGGAILALVLVSAHFGGPAGWWPTEWPTHWPDPKWGYDPDPRSRTFFAALIGTLVWFVCTSGSDQMAIQRYQATRNAKAARRTLVASLTASAFASLFLSLVGLALLAYLRDNPHLVADGQRILSDADKAFPRFIAYGLPAGLSGLVMAGLLAAAMSSLSSGVNSSCSVITSDFVDRFRRLRDVESDHVRQAKYISVVVGVVVVALSTGVGMVQGNLIALAFKICNLLTAPLFGLFFMAIFVRFATGFGTLVGAAFGLATVVLISYWEEIFGVQGISFLWAMPLGLFVQVAVGTLISLLPIGTRRPPLPKAPPT